jgi:hypothetical protein
MITFTPNVKWALQQDTIEAFYMLRILQETDCTIAAAAVGATTISLLPAVPTQNKVIRAGAIVKFAGDTSSYSVVTGGDLSDTVATTVTITPALTSAKLVNTKVTFEYNVIHSTSLFMDIDLLDSADLPVPGHSYISDDTIASVDAPQATTNVDREQFRILLNDPRLESMETVFNNLIGYPIEVRLGFLNVDTCLPFFKFSDTLLVYKGRVDSTAYSIKTQEMGEAVLQVTGSSPMRSLDAKNSLFLSRDYVRQLTPKDSSCDQIFEGSEALVLKWGRI